MESFCRRVACCLALIVLLALPAGAETEPHVRTLDNGLQVVVQEHHTAPVAAFRIYVRAGSIYEGQYLGSGISHYFEHLISGGTTSNRTEAQISRIIERLGNANNAYTTRDHTAYHITTSPEHLQEAIDLFADWMQNCTFPESEFKREKGVVLEEVRKSREEPRRVLHKALYETMFRRHPARYPVIGFEPLVKKIRREDILRYYRTMYAPNNMIVVAAGDFEAKKVTGWIARAFSGFPRRNIDLPSPDSEPRQMGKRARRVTRKGLGKVYFQLGFHTVALDHPDLFPLDVLSYVLSHGRSSRLVAQVQEKQRLVSSISTYSYTPSYGAGVFGVYGTCEPGKADEAIRAVLEVIYDTREELVSETELAKARRQKVADNAFGRRTAEDIASDLGINMLGTGNPTFNETYLDGIRKVTAEGVRTVARKYLQDSNLTVVTLGPEGVEAGPKQEPRAAEEAGGIRKIVLENGLRVLIKRNPGAPLVHVQWLSLGGARLDPEGKAGLSRITANLLSRGTETMSAQQTAATFDSMGARLSPISGNNSLGLRANVLKDDFDRAFELFAQMIRQPAFPPEQLETVKRRTLAAVSGRRDNWQSELSYLFRKKYFGEHPYASGALGEAETVKSVTRSDVLSFYRGHLVPERSVLTVFGDVDPDATAKAARRLFGRFSNPGKDLPQIPPPPEMKEDETIRMAISRGLSAVYMGYPGIRLTNTEDRVAMHVLDAVLSGIGYPGGWLQRDLRGGNRDLVYVVHAFNFMGLEPGYFGIIAASSPAKMDRVIEIIHEDVERVREELVGEEELQRAKNMCVTMDKLENQTNSAMAMQRGLSELYGLGYEFPDRYEEQVRAVTAEDVRRVAQKYLDHALTLRLDPRQGDRTQR